MKTKHTQGEWKITSIPVSEDNSFPYSIITGYDSVSICVVDKDGSNTYEEYEANAKLIAAAPDMLDCLQNIFREIQSLGRGESLFLDEWEIEKIIKKATE